MYQEPTRRLSDLSQRCHVRKFACLLARPLRLRSPLLGSRGGGLNDPRRSDCGFRSPLLLLLLLPVLARKVLRSGHDDHHDRSHYHQPEIKQNWYCDPASEVIVEERYGKVNRSVQEDHHQEAPPCAIVHPGEEDTKCEGREHETSVDEGSVARCSVQPKR